MLWVRIFGSVSIKMNRFLSLNFPEILVYSIFGEKSAKKIKIFVGFQSIKLCVSIVMCSVRKLERDFTIFFQEGRVSGNNWNIFHFALIKCTVPVLRYWYLTLWL